MIRDIRNFGLGLDNDLRFYLDLRKSRGKKKNLERIFFLLFGLRNKRKK